MHRLYYHEANEAFYFAAEAKAILAVRPELRRTDPRGLGEFVACGCVLENRTLFEGVHVLPAASAWTFRAGSIERKKTYFQPREWEEQGSRSGILSPRDSRDFLTSLPRYFNGHQRVGVSLTGGLDTRAVMACQPLPSGSLPCYTYGGDDRECRDVLVARKVASLCQQTHDVIAVGGEFLSSFPHYAERSVYLTDGCIDLTPFSRPVRQRESPQNRSGEDDRTLWRRGTPALPPRVKTGRAHTRPIPPGVSSQFLSTKRV